MAGQARARPSLDIEVRLFANLADHLPRGARGPGARVTVPAGATVADLVRLLAIPESLPCLALVNGLDARPDRTLRAGDVVSLLPPLAGGGAGPTPSRGGAPAGGRRP